MSGNRGLCKGVFLAACPWCKPGVSIYQRSGCAYSWHSGAFCKTILPSLGCEAGVAGTCPASPRQAKPLLPNSSMGTFRSYFALESWGRDECRFKHPPALATNRKRFVSFGLMFRKCEWLQSLYRQGTQRMMTLIGQQARFGQSGPQPRPRNSE